MEQKIEFQVGDYVKKVTGEYQIHGTVVSVFKKLDGATRLVVEHKAEGGGSFLHIYGPSNLEKVEIKSHEAIMETILNIGGIVRQYDSTSTVVKLPHGILLSPALNDIEVVNYLVEGIIELRKENPNLEIEII